MPLLRGSVLALVLLEVLAPSEGDQIASAANMNATRELQEFLKGLFGGMPLLGFGEQPACGNRLLFPDQSAASTSFMASTIFAASLASS